MQTTPSQTAFKPVALPITPIFRIKIDFKVTRGLMESDFDFSQRYEKLLLDLSVQDKNVEHEVFLNGQRKPAFLVLESKSHSCLQTAAQRALQVMQQASATSSLLPS